MPVDTPTANAPPEPTTSIQHCGNLPPFHAKELSSARVAKPGTSAARMEPDIPWVSGESFAPRLRLSLVLGVFLAAGQKRAIAWLVMRSRQGQRTPSP